MDNKIDMREFSDLVAERDDLNIIDVRPDKFYQAGHVPGTLHMPLDTLEENLDKLDKDAHYYTYCHDGVGAAKSAQLLEENGFNVTRVEQGFPEFTGEIEVTE